MKNGFYMGYDASGLEEEELLRQVRILLDDGWYSAGYQTLCLGYVGDEKRGASARAASMGFQIGISVDAQISTEELAQKIAEFHPRMVTIVHQQDAEKTKELAAAVPAGIRVAIQAPEQELSWAAKVADTVIINTLDETTDYFEVTRNQLDSCRDDDVDVCASAANLRAACLEKGGTYQVGTLPVRFDYYRNEAIFLQICMTGSPLVLKGDLGAITPEYAALACDEDLIRMAAKGAGRVLRYYDPWHVLLGKADSDKYAYALILNRCHGDQPTNILPADLGWEGRFAVSLWPENELVGASLESYEVHVETSDHPQTPCCRLVRLERL